MPDTAAPEIRDLPVQVRAADVVPGTFNAEDNSVDVVWTTGARVRRYDWFNDTPYEEELVVSPEAVDMSRFEAGTLQVLDGHNQYSGVRAILGIATRGWLDLDQGQGLAKCKLSKRQELAGIVGDIQDGVIRAISVGYSVQRYEVIRAADRTDGGSMPLYRAVRWTPSEISFVPVPADAQAATREDAERLIQRSQGLAPCEFIRAAARLSQENPMTEPVNTSAAGTNTTAQTTEQRQAAEAAAQATREAEQAALARAAEITALCIRSKRPEMAEDLIRSGKTVEQAGLAILHARAAEDEATGGHVNVARVRTVADEQDTHLRGMEEAILNRVDAKAKITDNGRQYRGMSLLEMGRDYLHARGVDTRGWDRMRLATHILQHRSGGMLTTSDFSSVLANVAVKRLRQAYDENPGSYTRWARRAPNAPDFKSMSVVQLSAMPDLLQVNEHGEFKYGLLRDGAETYGLTTYGRIVSITRQAMVNDDLRAFDRMSTGFGSASARLENRTVYAILTANAALSDSVALFHATHANLGSGAPSALQFSSLVTARTAMRVQKGLQSEELNLVPSYLIVPAALEQTAYQLTSSQYTPAQQSNVSEFRAGGRTALDPVVEPILDANSATAWYLAAANSQVDTVEFCYLDGAEGPVMETDAGFEVDGLSFKCRLDFAAKAVDYRGLYKSAGA